MSSVVPVDEEQRVSAVDQTGSCGAFWDLEFLAVSSEQEAVALRQFAMGSPSTWSSSSPGCTSLTCWAFRSSRSWISLIPFPSWLTTSSSSSCSALSAIHTWTPGSANSPRWSLLSRGSWSSRGTSVTRHQLYFPGYVLPSLASPPRGSQRSLGSLITQQSLLAAQTNRSSDSQSSHHAFLSRWTHCTLCTR